MKYVILGDDNKEYGPIDGDTLVKWVEHGRVHPETPVRNTMIKKWNKAKDFDFLKQPFAVQFQQAEKEKSFKEKTVDALLSIIRTKKTKNIFMDGTAFRHAYIHENAGVFLRIATACTDGIVVFIYFLVLAFICSAVVQSEGGMPAETSPSAPGADLSSSAPGAAGSDAAVPAAPAPPAAESQGSEAASAMSASPPLNSDLVNSVFSKAFIAFVLGILLYYGITLGLFAQTFGMWFWGLLIVRKDLGEVFLGRAYLYSFLMLALGLPSLLLVYLSPYRRSLQEILTNTMLIRTAARPKA